MAISPVLGSTQTCIEPLPLELTQEAPQEASVEGSLVLGTTNLADRSIVRKEPNGNQNGLTRFLRSSSVSPVRQTRSVSPQPRESELDPLASVKRRISENSGVSATRPPNDFRSPSRRQHAGYTASARVPINLHIPPTEEN